MTDHPFDREVDAFTVELQLDPDQAEAADESIVRWLISLFDDPPPGAPA